MTRDDLHSNRLKRVAAEVARVRAALPPLGAPAVRLQHLADEAGLDTDTALRRTAILCAAGEASAQAFAGALSVRRAEPIVRTAAAEEKRSRFALPEWVPTPEPRQVQQLAASGDK